VGKKQLELNFSGMRVVPWQVAVVVAFRKNFQLSLLRAKLTFTACSPTEFMVLPEDHL
jgi:hypothetical protein